MAKWPTTDEWVERIGNKVINEFTYNGKALKEWIELMASGTERIPVKYRDMSQEEIERYSEYTEDTKMFDCKMPEHQESILATIEYERAYERGKADAQPKTGRWIYDNNFNNWRCSECGETPRTMGYCGAADFMAEHFKYCNHCGARMVSE